MVLVEALASGTPCIGSRVGGIPDVITPDVGKVVDAGDVTGLAEAIIVLTSNVEIWNLASVNARHRAEQEYDWQVLVKRITDIYQNVISGDNR